MKIALIGYGKMGRAVERAAFREGHQVVARIDPVAGEAEGREISGPALAGADICVEFTTPAAAPENCRALIALGKPVVSGTTGWHERLNEVRSEVEHAQGAFLYASNFSIGINLFYRLVETAAQLFERFPQYDPYIYELHHAAKADSPSGTALELARIVIEQSRRKQRIAPVRLERAIQPEELCVASARAGGIAGKHVVGFEGPHDGITLSHLNRSRESLAQGVMLALEWLAGRTGFFAFAEVIDDLLKARR